MGKSPQSKIKAATENPYVTINANGTDYKVQTYIHNSRGEIKFIDSNAFSGLLFETNYNTPFLLGVLTVNDELNSTVLNKVDLEDSSPFSELNSYGDGGEFIRVIVKTKSKEKFACDYTDDLVLDKTFVTSKKLNTIQNNIKLVKYYFADVVWSHFQNKNKEWSTDVLNEFKLKNVQMKRGQSKVNSGRALKDILRYFSNDDDIIDEDRWDDGIGKVYYTLPAGSPAFDAIAEIMKTYVSSDESGGILTYFSGKFQLQSIRSSINKIYKSSRPREKATDHIISKTHLGDNFGGAIKIQTNDNRQSYSNKEAGNILGKEFNYIPVDNSNITFVDTQPDATLNTLNKKEVTQFNPKTKQFTIHSHEGTLSAVESKTGLESLPDGKDNKINIDENTNFSNNKSKLFKMTDSNTTMYYGTIKLQKQLLESLTKAKFAMPGMIDMSANKFLYMNVDLNSKNKFANKIPGFWYITKNLTTLSKGTFASNIECVKLDKPK